MISSPRAARSISSGRRALAAATLTIGVLARRVMMLPLDQVGHIMVTLLNQAGQGVLARAEVTAREGLICTPPRGADVWARGRTRHTAIGPAGSSSADTI